MKTRDLIVLQIVAVLCGAHPARSCVLNPNYMRLPLEQRIAEAKVVFLGHVESIECEQPKPPAGIVPKPVIQPFVQMCETVHIVKDETLVGDADREITVPQGWGPDCLVTFDVGERLFFSGTGLLSGTTNLNDGVPPELSAVIDKLRHKIPLQHRTILLSELLSSLFYDDLLYESIYRSVGAGIGRPQLLGYSDQDRSDYDDKSLVHLLAWHDYWDWVYKKDYQKLLDTDEKIAKLDPSSAFSRLLPVLDEQRLGWLEVRTAAPQAKPRLQAALATAQLIAKDFPREALAQKVLAQGCALLAAAIIRDGDTPSATSIVQMGRNALDKWIELSEKGGGALAYRPQQVWFEHALLYLAQPPSSEANAAAPAPATSLGVTTPLLRELTEANGNGAPTPLMAASMHGDVDAVKKLITEGADVNSRTNAGETALIFVAGAWGEADDKDVLVIVNALLAKGADANAKTTLGKTALMEAARTDRIEVARALLAKGAQLNAVDGSGRSALAFSKGTAVHDLLVQSGAVNAPAKVAVPPVVTLQALIDDATKFQKMIDSPDLHEASRAALRSFKTITENLISAKILAVDCDQLRATESTLLPGRYNLYPTRDPLHPTPVDCK